jgi:hypothetical protein
MTPKELEQEVWKLIDDNCMEMSKEEYLDFLLGIRDDADIRAESVKIEIDNEGE